MNKKIITLLGSLALVVSLGARATTDQDILNHLNTDPSYNNLSAEEQDMFNDVLEQSLSNLDERGIDLSDAGSQMFLISTIKGILGLSAAKEDAKKLPAPMPAASNSGNADSEGLSMTDTNAHYGAIWDAVKDLGSAVADKVGSMAGKVSEFLKPKPAPEATEPAGNSLNNEIALDDANAHYGAIWDAVKGLGSAVADKVGSLASKASELLKPKPVPEATEPAGNSLNNEIALDDANAHYGAIWDAVKGLGSAVADKVGSLAGKASELLKPKPVPAPTPDVME